MTFSSTPHSIQPLEQVDTLHKSIPSSTVGIKVPANNSHGINIAEICNFYKQ